MGRRIEKIWMRINQLRSLSPRARELRFGPYPQITIPARGCKKGRFHEGLTQDRTRSHVHKGSENFLHPGRQPHKTLAQVYREVQASAGQATLLMRLLAENPLPTSSIAHLPLADTPWALKLTDLGVTIDQNVVVDGLNLSIPAAGRLFITGASGIGKSSLLRVLGCLVPASGGHLHVENIEVTEANAEAFRNGVAVAYQDCMLFDLTIRENIALGSAVSNGDIDAIMSELGLNEVSNRHRDESISLWGNAATDCLAAKDSASPWPVHFSDLPNFCCSMSQQRSLMK